MHSLALYFTRCLIENDMADESHREDYIYGLEMAFGKFLNYTTLLVIALYYGKLIQSIIFMAAFFSLRGRTGGFHAKTALQCYIGTTGIYLLAIKGVVPFIMGNLYVYVGILIFSSIIIIAFAPVNHPALCLNGQEIEQCKKSSRRVLFLEVTCIGLAVLVNGKMTCLAYAVTGIGMDATLLCIAKIVKQEVRENEESK